MDKFFSWPSFFMLLKSSYNKNNYHLTNRHHDYIADCTTKPIKTYFAFTRSSFYIINVKPLIAATTNNKTPQTIKSKL